MTKVLFKRKTSDEIANLPVEDGALIYNYETGATYLDYDDERISTGGGMPTGDTFPIGAITSYAGSIAPTNWLICDGSAISRTTYADLFDAIGTTYGVGDGSTTFNLPNLKGRVITGLDSSQTEFDTLGETGGEKAHTLTIAEMPSHKHNMRVKQNASGFSDGYPAGGNTYEYSNNEYPIQNTGGGQPHNNLQPYITLNYIIKAFQSSGTVANVSTTETNSDTDTYSCNYINKLIPNAITDNYINVSNGSLNKNHSFKIGDAIFLELKFTGVTLSSSNLMVIATLNSPLVPSSEVTIMASTDKGGVTYGWIRTNGEIVVKTSVAGSNADVRINAFYM